MDSLAGKKPAVVWALNISVLALVLLWIFPTLGLFVSSFRTNEQITSSGWWASLFPAEQTLQLRAIDPDDFRIETDTGVFVVEGTIFAEDDPLDIEHWGTSSREPDAYEIGETADLGDGETIILSADGSYVWQGNDDQISGRGQRIFVIATVPPEFTTSNYNNVLFSPTNSENMAVVASLVVPLQLALIPLLSLHNAVGIGKGYLGIWLAHTGFGLPLAIYLLRNYMVGLPRDIIENARVDGATEFQIFTKIILPLSFPALASFAIFQFLWTWNDLLVALVFLIDSSGQTTVMTKQIVELLGTRGGDWEILATSAFVSIAVPLLVFFLMQRYLVRGLLAGSVK